MRAELFFAAWQPLAAFLAAERRADRRERRDRQLALRAREEAVRPVFDAWRKEALMEETLDALMAYVGVTSLFPFAFLRGGGFPLDFAGVLAMLSEQLEETPGDEEDDDRLVLQWTPRRGVARSRPLEDGP